MDSPIHIPRWFPLWNPCSSVIILREWVVNCLQGCSEIRDKNYGSPKIGYLANHQELVANLDRCLQLCPELRKFGLELPQMVLRSLCADDGFD